MDSEITESGLSEGPFGLVYTPESGVDTDPQEEQEPRGRSPAARARKKAERTRGMGSTYQRGNVWWIVYYVRGKRIRESTKSSNSANAAKLLKQRIGDAATGKPVGPDIERTKFEDLKTILINKYKADRRRSLPRVEDALSHLEGFFDGYKAGDITSDRVIAYVVHRQAEDAANATINRELAALKRAFRLADDARRVAMIPKISMLEENNEREGFIEQTQFALLHGKLPERLRDPVKFLWLTGWRVGEMRSLRWSSVYDGAIRLAKKNSKNKRGREIALRGELNELIARARDRRDPVCPYVFHFKGKSIGSFRKAWATAAKNIGIPTLLVHDLRRSAVRNLIRAGVSQNVAMKITGHRTDSVFRRYDITSSDDVGDAFDKLESHLSKPPTETKDEAQQSAAG